jgi:hypothetical protein
VRERDTWKTLAENAEAKLRESTLEQGSVPTGPIPSGNSDGPGDLRDLLSEARRYVDDDRLYYNEHAPRARRESQQAHDDRMSTAIQENEDRRDLLQRIDAALKAPSQGSAT